MSFFHIDFWKKDISINLLTEVDLEVNGDVFFPKINMEEWSLVSTEAHRAEGKNEHDYTFKKLTRKKKSPQK